MRTILPYFSTYSKYANVKMIAAFKDILGSILRSPPPKYHIFASVSYFHGKILKVLPQFSIDSNPCQCQNIQVIHFDFLICEKCSEISNWLRFASQIQPSPKWNTDVNRGLVEVYLIFNNCTESFLTFQINFPQCFRQAKCYWQSAFHPNIVSQSIYNFATC